MSLLDRAVWQIETRLRQPLSLTGLAALGAVSPYHLSRTFQAAAGLSPMSYVRARRLSVAAEALADCAGDILEIALAAQYGSHEAFTRAFTNHFGHLPSAVRAARSVDNLTLMEPLRMNESIPVEVPPPEIRTRDAFRVVGLGIVCPMDDTSAIPPLWQSFNERVQEIAESAPGVAYGVCHDAGEPGRFRYLAGVEAAMAAELPADMQAIAIPAGRYAVFVHSGHVAELPRTIQAIWNKALPDAGLEPRAAPDFERYDRRFDPATGRGVIEIWIPLD